jgi:hypothetical protein
MSIVRTSLKLLLAALVLTAPARASAEDQAVLDLRRAVRVQQALDEDPVLGPLRLWFIVRDGVAVLLDPVPSRELAERAAACLRHLPELSGVRYARLAEPVPGRPRSRYWQPASRSGESKRTAPPAWVPSPGAVPAVRSPTKPPAPPAVVPAPASSGLMEAIRHLQQGQECYRRLQVEVRGARVYLSGAAPRWEDLYELSDAITRIPGVAGVTLRAIRIDASPR